MIAARQIAFGGGKRKPYDAEVEYLESTGTQWIKTDFYPTNSSRMDAIFMITNTNKNAMNKIGISGGDGNNKRFAVGGYKKGVLYFGMSNKNYDIDLSTPTEKQRVQVFVDLAQKKYGYSWLYGQKTFNSTNVSYDSKYPVYLFNIQWITEPFVGRIYSVTLSEQGSVVNDFIPVRFTNENGEIEGAMYDKVSGELFRNVGKSAFIIGDDI